MARIEIFSSDRCPHCVQLKDFLKRKGHEFTEHRIDLDDASRDRMAKITSGMRTVPQVLVNGKHVGDEDTLYDLDRKGELDALLNG